MPIGGIGPAYVAGALAATVLVTMPRLGILGFNGQIEFEALRP